MIQDYGKTLFEGPTPTDNFLKAYAQGQEQKRADQQSQRADQQFQWQQQDHDLQTQDRKAQVVADALAMAKPGDAAGFEAIKQRLVQSGAIDAQTASQYDITRLPELQAKSEQYRNMKKFENDQRITDSTLRKDNAQIGLIGAQTAKERAAASNTGSSPLDPESIQYAAQVYRMTGQMPPMGQGVAGTAARREILRIAAAQSKAEGTGAAGDVANFADYAGARAGLGALGRRTANIDTAAQEADRFVDLSVASSKALPRGKFVPLNQALQLVQGGTSDPRLKDFVIKAQALANAAATVAGRGTTNQFLQEEYMKRLSAADGPEAFEAAAKAIQQESRAVVESTRAVRNDMLGNIRGNPGGSEKPATGAVQWKMDASGNLVKAP